MSAKVKLISLISVFILVLGLVVVGVLAASSQTITMHGSVNFVVNDRSLYVKEVRMQEAGSDPEIISNFTPGYINGNFDFNVGDFENSRGSFTLYFDIINTTTLNYTASVTVPKSYQENNIEVSITEDISASESEIEIITSETPITETLALIVINPNLRDIDLGDIIINLKAEIYTGYTFSGNTFVGYNGNETEIVIPSSYSIRESDGAFIGGNDYQVYAIGSSAFASNTTIRSVTIEEGVYYIFHSAFSGCTAIEDISIPDSIIDIHESAFKGCDSLNFTSENNLNYLGSTTNPYFLLYNATDLSLATYTINENCKIIYDDVFDTCNNMTSLIIPEGVKNIKSVGPTTITTLSIPSSAERLTVDLNDYTNLTFTELDGAKYIGNSTNNYVVFVSGPSSVSNDYAINSNCKILGQNSWNTSGSFRGSLPENLVSVERGAFDEVWSSGGLLLNFPTSIKHISARIFGMQSSYLYMTFPSTGSWVFVGNYTQGYTTSIEDVDGSDIDTIKSNLCSYGSNLASYYGYDRIS